MRFPRLLLFACMLLVASCSDSTDENASLGVSFYTPEGFPEPSYNLQYNPLSANRFLLGKKLFYDPVLSIDSTVSCGSCHQQFVAFANSEHRFSHGVNNQFGVRNAPALFNLAWNPEFFWDGGSHSLEMQPLGPITNPVEMADNLPNVLNKLKRSQTYPSLFRSAFGTDTITTDRLVKSLALFMAVLISDNSKYDFYRRGEATLTSAEMRGLNLFRANCASCHKEPMLSDYSYRNNGLDSLFVRDAGRAHITNLPQDSGKFKVPSLRNIVLTKPYMHDGRFNSLSQVLDHYTMRIKQSATLDPILVGGIQLSNAERSDLIAFLNTLTDYRFVNNKKFSED